MRRWADEVVMEEVEEEEVVVEKEVDNLLLRACVCVSGGTGSSTARHAAEHAPPAAALTSADPPPPGTHLCALTCVRYVCGPHDASDLLHGLEVWRETCGPQRVERGGGSTPDPGSAVAGGAELTSMAAEDLLVHDGGDGQAVEAVSEGLPQLDVEPAFTCKRSGRSEPRWPPKAWVA